MPINTRRLVQVTKPNQLLKYYVGELFSPIVFLNRVESESYEEAESESPPQP